MPETGRLLRTSRVHTLTPSMAFSPDSKALVVGEVQSEKAVAENQIQRERVLPRHIPC